MAGPSQAIQGLGALLGGGASAYNQSYNQAQQNQMQNAYMQALYGQKMALQDPRLQAQQNIADQNNQLKAQLDAANNAEKLKAAQIAANKAKGTKGAGAANDWLANVERELASAASVQQLGNQHNLWDTNPTNIAANAALHAQGIPGAGALATASLPPGAFDLNAQGENATIALARALSSGRPAASTIAMLKGHRANIGGGKQAAQEAWDATLGSARSIAEGELAKQYYNDPTGAQAAKDKLNGMFGDFQSGGKRNPFASVTGQSGLVAQGDDNAPVPKPQTSPAPAATGWTIEPAN